MRRCWDRSQGFPATAAGGGYGTSRLAKPEPSAPFLRAASTVPCPACAGLAPSETRWLCVAGVSKGQRMGRRGRAPGSGSVAGRNALCLLLGAAPAPEAGRALGLPPRSVLGRADGRRGRSGAGSLRPSRRLGPGAGSAAPRFVLAPSVRRCLFMLHFSFYWRVWTRTGTFTALKQ